MTTSNRSIVYVSCSKGDCIQVFGLDRITGELDRVETVALSGNGMPLTIAPDKRHLYAAVSTNVEGKAEPRYVTYRIEPATGALQHVSTIKAPGRMSHITVDRSGRNLLGASVANDLIASTAIKQNGTLDAEPTEIRSVPSKAHQITTDLSNKYAYVPNLGADLVMQLRFDEVIGRFTDSTPPEIEQPKGACPRHIAHHPSGNYCYLLNEEDGSIVAFKIKVSDGTLKQIQTSNFLPESFGGKPWGAQILSTPDGRFLYASERTSSTISLHAIDTETGLMTKRAVWSTETCPRNFAIDPSGHWLIAAGEKSNRVACYSIDHKIGDLTERSTQTTGAGPLWIEVLELT